MDGDLGRFDQKFDARTRAKRRTSETNREKLFVKQEKMFVSLDDENHGSELGVEFSLLVNQFVGSDGRRFVGRCE